MISHDPHALMTYCERGALLDQGKLTFYDSIEELSEAYHTS